MKEFLKFTFASVAGVIIAFVLIFLVFMGIFVSAVNFAEDEVVLVKDQSILEIKLSQTIHDRGVNQPFYPGNFEMEKSMGLDQVLDNLKKAAVDNNIKGILINLTGTPQGAATNKEIRDALLKFKESGKFIVSYSENYSQGAYYLASVADKVYMHPEGGMFFKGLNAEIMFYKGLLEKVKVEAQVIRHGEFKSAVEPFILNKMSEASRLQTQKFIDEIWDVLVEDISKSRNISVEDLNRIADDLAVNLPDGAMKHKLVDGLIYRDQLENELRERSGLDADEDLRLVKFSKYTDALVSEYKKLRSKNKIAVVYATGAIESGKGDDLTIGSDRIAGAIADARKDSTIKAIVMRVNSPGGSALASDVIWRELVLAKKQKPVVVSFGNVAASGGYYISTHADKIFASPVTITGSIGVFGMIPNFKPMMNELLGVTTDNVKTNMHADYISVTRKMSDYEYDVTLKGVEKVYESFTNKVAEGRQIPIDKVLEIAEGRVWAGTTAKKIKLVDEFGGLDDAIEAAAELAELDNYRTISLPKQKDPITEIIEQLTGQQEQTAIKAELGPFYKYYQHLKALSEMEGIQARLPYEIDIY
ncbi:MAG: signal peptide peptidase SppA [Bacteroidales bacterium]|nr:signal peptide peptidase SppA [Bacteroidales bacterium]